MPFAAFLCAATQKNATIDTSSGLPGDGPPGHRARTATRTSPTRRTLSRERTSQREPAVSDAERVDVCIVGLGLRRLDLRLPAGRALPRRRRRRRASSCSSAASATCTPTSASRWTSSTSRSVYGLIQGQGAQVVIGDGVGGGSNLYLAASLRSPSETFERRTTTPTTAPTGACGRRRSAAQTLDPYYARAEQALRVQRPTWNQVAKAGGLWAATLNAAGHTCDRVPSGDRPQPLHPGALVSHRLHLRREELGDHQLPRRRPSRSAWRSAPTPRSS